MRLQLDFGTEPKQYFFPNISRSLLCIRNVAVASRSEEDFFEEGDPMNYFGPALELLLGGSGQNALKRVRGLEYLIDTKFHQTQSSGSEVKAYYVFLYIHIYIQKF